MNVHIVPMEAVSTWRDPAIRELLLGRSFESGDSFGREPKRESASKLNEKEGLAGIVGHGRGTGLDSIGFTRRSNRLLVLLVELARIGTGRLSHGASSIPRGTAADSQLRFGAPLGRREGSCDGSAKGQAVSHRRPGEREPLLRSWIPREREAAGVLGAASTHRPESLSYRRP
jgi:hypothetical protein